MSPMVLRSFTSTQGVTLILLAMTSGACACDGRAAEPSAAPERVQTAPTVKQSKRSAAPIASSVGKVASAKPRPSTIRIGERCIKETPPEPEREVSGPVPNPRCPIDPGPVPTLTSKTLTISGPADGPRTVQAEVVEHDKERQRGLMYRTSMADSAGMLFVFEQERELSFWMHNTCIPLDMIFIASDGTIVGIEENTPTLSDDTFSVGCPGRYVLEVNAGWTRKNGVRAGMKVEIPS